MPVHVFGCNALAKMVESIELAHVPDEYRVVVATERGKLLFYETKTALR